MEIEGAPRGEFEEFVIGCEWIPDETDDSAGREDDLAAVPAYPDVDVEVEVKKDDNGETSFKAAAAQQDVDEGSDSEGAVDGLV